jgi:hypothetical protein
MEGLKQLVSDREHRQEIVANGLGSYLTFRAFAVRLPRSVYLFVLFPDFMELSRRLGNRAGEFWNHFLINQRKTNHTIHFLKWFSGELPEVSISISVSWLYLLTCFPRLPLG